MSAAALYPRLWISGRASRILSQPYVPPSRILICIVLGAAVVVGYFATLRVIDKPLKAFAGERTSWQTKPR